MKLGAISKGNISIYVGTSLRDCYKKHYFLFRHLLKGNLKFTGYDDFALYNRQISDSEHLKESKSPYSRGIRGFGHGYSFAR